jgi:hypothetical protein
MGCETNFDQHLSPYADEKLARKNLNGINNRAVQDLSVQACHISGSVHR